MSRTHIWWIRRDIRLQDNQTLEAARRNADFLIPLFILEPEIMRQAAPKRRDFILAALADLDRQLRNLGSRLIVRQGPAQQALQKLSDDLDDVTIFAHEDFSPFARQRDLSVSQFFPINHPEGVTLLHPSAILKDDGDPYTVFTPYKNKWYESPIPTPTDCLPAPNNLPPLPQGVDAGQLPEAQAPAHFPATSSEAQSRLQGFADDGIQHYQSLRDRMDLDGTSLLSPYLRFGLISIREAFVEAQIAYHQSKTTKQRSEIRTWMDELVWREFYTAILYHFPNVMAGAFREKYQNIQWRNAPDDLQAWQDGKTGYPIVDACMRQLAHTGWMHNRGRMITASFLTKDLLINWQEGEAWFMANLVDGDPAANNGGWQWSAGTGTDAAPYFRIFNPVLQGQKYDPEGDYIAHWVPELKHLPVKFRHEPWKINPAEAEKYGFKYGSDYPKQIVDHKFARQRTLDAYSEAKDSFGEDQEG